MKLIPDSCHVFKTQKEVERHFLLKKFCGPGLYLFDDRTLLIIMSIDEPNGKNCVNKLSFWSADQPEEAQYYAYVYNARLDHTILGGFVPTRYDNRTLKIQVY